MGTSHDSFDSSEKAKRVMDVLIFYEVNPSETFRALAGNVIKGLASQPTTFASIEFLEANSRWLNGDTLCDALGFGKSGICYRALVAGQCFLVMALCYVHRSFPHLDKENIEVTLPIIHTQSRLMDIRQ